MNLGAPEGQAVPPSSADVNVPIDRERYFYVLRNK